MTREFDENSSIPEKISPRDKEVILIAPIYFWAKYMRRAINAEGFELQVPKFDSDDPISILKAGFALRRQANSDIEGNTVDAVSNTISEHPKRNELFPHLDDEQIEWVCQELDDIFENQEFCALCESWSYYDADSPEEFAIDVADTMLYLRGEYLGISWFTKIHRWKDRQPIIRAVIEEKLPNQPEGLLLPQAQ